MMTARFLIRAFAPLVLAVSATLPAHAQLPALGEQPWLGYFAVHSGSRQIFGIDSFGEMQLRPVHSDNPGPLKYTVKISPRILETAPSGKTTAKKVIADSLETSDEATGNLRKTTYRGKVTGGASFEVTVEQQRDIIYVTGRLLDPGTIKNPLQMAISVKMPVLYPGDLEPFAGLSEREKKREEKALADKLKGDRASFKWTDGKSLKLDTSEGADVTDEKLSGPGIASLELESTVFRKRKFMIDASPGTMMTARRPEAAALLKGFELQWVVDAAKDPDGKARLALQFR